MSELASVAIVTDSTSDLPPELAAALGVTVVPLTVNFGEESFHDGELSQAEFFAKMNAASKLPTTSTPGVGAFEQAFEKALASAEHVVALHISGALSGTIEAARAAADRFGDRVHVHDSLNLSWGLGWQVVRAARAAQAGSAMADVVAVAERTRERVRMIVGIDKLDNLAKGGRIGAVSVFLGGMLDFKVTFTVDGEGKYQPVARSRGAKAMLKDTMAWVKKEMGESTKGAFCVAHAMSLDRAEAMRQMLESTYDVTEMFVVETGVVLATHTGTGYAIALVPE
ncbi:MAG: DegV family protein [Coriobacteriia bacterium]|nr:DegV family protein [Coriobacteriia bacterium]